MSRFNLTAFRVSALATLLAVLLYGLGARSVLLRNLEAKALDLRFYWRGPRTPATPMALVVIDDRSIAELGRWPWTRWRFVEIVQRLRQAGARVIGFDLLFTEAESAAEREVLQRWRRSIEAGDIPASEAVRQALPPLWQQLERLADADAALAAAFGAADDVVLAFAATTDPAASAQPPPAFLARSAYRTLVFAGPQPPTLPLVGTALLPPIEGLGEAAAALGHVNAVLDSDGTPRYEYPVLAYAGEYYPAFALQMARRFLGVPPEAVHVRFGEGIQLGPLCIPTDESMRLLVNYAGPRGTFPTYAFVDVLRGRLPDAIFKDAIVLIGGAASGLGDTFVTPFAAALSGVERHATIVDSILRQDFLQRRQATALLDGLGIVGLGLLVGWLAWRCPTFWGSLMAVGAAGLYVAGNVAAFIYAGLWLNLLGPLAAIALNHSAVTLFRFLAEERQKRQIRRAFQHYLDPAVVDQVSQQPQRLKLGGEARELTVLFADVRGFSAIAERLAPEALVRLLNAYLTAMTRVVFQHGGLLDKYIGDGLMAVYGAPLPAPDHAYRACCTALGMVAALRELQQRWAREGWPELRIGVGINTAVMVVGNMGSEVRFAYTVMGDGVNVASRLEGANKAYGTAIIVGEATWERVRDRLAARELDVVRVWGKGQPTRIFELLGPPPLPPAQAALLCAFEAGLQAYRARHWEEAAQRFQLALELAPLDAPSQLYLQRCQAFMATPPPQWDGIYDMPSK
jgi:adenylate cyclase